MFTPNGAGAFSIPKAPYVLGLEGGGAFGAFTAGVLCTLLADPRIPLPAAISGTSAGAVNAVVMAHAMTNETDDGAARRRIIHDLHNLWHDRLPHVMFEYMRDYMGPGPAMLGRMVMPPVGSLYNWYLFLDLMMETWLYMGGTLPRVPANHNPLAMLLRHVDFEQLNQQKKLKLYIATTLADNRNASRVFTESELSADVVAASGALPDRFEPITIDGVRYMEGGYHHNPPLLQPFADGFAELLLVRLNADDVNPPRHLLEQRIYDLAQVFSEPLKRDLALLADQGLAVSEVAMQGHYGFRPPDKTKTSRLMLSNLFKAGEAAARAALDTLNND